MFEERVGTISVKYNNKMISMEFDEGLTVEDFIDEVVAPMMISMGYFPSNVYEGLCLEDTVDVLRKHYKGEL